MHASSCTGVTVQKLGAHRLFFFHVRNGTHKVAPFACSTAAILWRDGPEGSQIGSPRAGAGPPDTAQVAPRLRGDDSSSPFFCRVRFFTLMKVWTSRLLD